MTPINELTIENSIFRLLRVFITQKSLTKFLVFGSQNFILACKIVLYKEIMLLRIERAGMHSHDTPCTTSIYKGLTSAEDKARAFYFNSI